MKGSVDRVVTWLDRYLNLELFEDNSNNSLQIAREGDALSLVAFGVDASAAFVREAAAAGAQLCVVHHGISWGGGIKRITGSEYRVVKAAMENNIALYAAHLPLDAHREVGNNVMLARHLGLTGLKRAFSYRGNVIGVTGIAASACVKKIGETEIRLKRGEKVGVCSGGAGDLAIEAKKIGCDVFVTGEATWGECIAAENVGMNMVLAGHYATETFGIKALSAKMVSELGVKTVFIDRK